MFRKNSRIIRLQGILLLLFFCSGNIVSETNYSAVETYRMAVEALQKRNYQTAIDLFRKAIEKNPRYIDAYLGTAQAFFEQGELIQARSYYTLVHEKEPENLRAKTGLGRVDTELGEYDKANDYLAQVAKMDPGDVENNCARGEYYLKTQKLDLAYLYFNKAIQRSPSTLQALLGLSRVDALKKRYKSAEKFVEKARRIDPAHPLIHQTRGEIKLIEAISREDISDLEKKGLMEMAARSFITADQILSNNLQIEKQILIIDLFQRNVSEARKRAENILRKSPDKHEINYIYAYLLRNELDNSPDSIKESIAYLRQSLNVEPHDSIARFNLEKMAVLNSRYQSTGGILRKNLAIYNYNRAKYYRSKNLKDKSDQFLRRTLYLDPLHVNALMDRLEYFRLNKDFERYIHTLTILRNRKISDFKLQYRLETALNEKQNSMAYRENLLSSEGSQEKSTFKRTPTIIFAFDFQPMEYFPVHPDAPRLLAESLIFHLQERGRVKPVSDNFRHLAIREINKIRKKEPFYTFGNYYDADYISYIEEIEKQENEYVDLLVGGKYRSSPTGLAIRYEIYRKKTGELLEEFELHSNGQDSIHDVSDRAAIRILAHAIYEGRVVKKRHGFIFVNVGTIDGLKKGDEPLIYRSNRISSGISPYDKSKFSDTLIKTGIGNLCRVAVASRYISKCVAKETDRNKVEPGDKVILYKDAKINTGE